MPAQTITLTDHSDAELVLALEGVTTHGANYKDPTRALSLPMQLAFNFNVASPGAKGNDKLNITIRNAVQNSTTSVVSTGHVKLEVSVPRDAAAWADGSTEDLLAYLSSLLSDATIREAVADAMVPADPVVTP